MPVITIDPTETLPPGSVSVGATNWNGGLEATTHLIGLGHRRIAFLGGPTSSVPSMERYQGYLSALAMHGVSRDEALATFGPFAYETGLREGRRLLSLPEGERPTAVFAASDTTAIGVCEAARERGLMIPTDLSVVGFDDCDIASWTTPGLTTVHQPLALMGGEAVRMVLNHAEGQLLQSAAPVQLTTTLTVRASTAPPTCQGTPPRSS